MKPHIDDLLSDIQVSDDWETAREAGNKYWPEGWHAVSTPHGGIVAYFQYEADAFAYRLNLINLLMSAGDSARIHSKENGLD